MLNSKYFSKVETLDELRKVYKQLLKKYHPDNAGGSTEICQEINADYEKAFEELKRKAFTSKDSSDGEGLHFENMFNSKYDKILRDTIQKVINLDGVEIEICGYWIWLGGNTYPIKDQIKAAGFHYSASKKKWYFDPSADPENPKKRRGHYSMNQIRNMHGSLEVKGGHGYGPKELTDK